MNTDSVVISVCCLLLPVAVLVILWWPTRAAVVKVRYIPVELQKALEVILKAGYDLEKNGHHLYLNKQKQYQILHFDRRGNVSGNVDESYQDLHEAINRHLELAPPEIPS